MNTTDLNPGEILNISGYYWKTCTLHTGVELDIFTIIGSQKMTSHEVARKIEGDTRGVTALLNALTAMELLEKSDDKYSNTPLSNSFLSKESPRYMGYIIQHHKNILKSWANLDEAVKTGKPIRASSDYDDEKYQESFLKGMFNVAMQLAPQIADKLDLSKKCRLLDLGGGPGTYAIHFCLKNPDLKAVIFDLATTKEIAMETVEKFDLSDRIDFIGGDYLEDDIKGEFDVVWISHILHAQGPKDCQLIIQKAVSSLKPNGMVVIHDFILNNSMDSPLFPTLFSLNMLVGTHAGQSYSQGQITSMLEEAGLKEIRRIPIESPNDSGIVTGLKL